MPLSLSELTNAISAAARAAGRSASTAGKDLTGDVERFVLPQMEGIASQIISIETGGFDEDTAKLLMSMEINHVSSWIKRADVMAGPFGPFESTFERLGDTLINKVADEIFGDSGAARQTRRKGWS